LKQRSLSDEGLRIRCGHLPESRHVEIEGRLSAGQHCCPVTLGQVASVLKFSIRMNSIVDESTRNVQIQATLANPTAKLRAGMFVQTEVLLGASRAAVTLPASAISYAACGNPVFVVEDLNDSER
jgi:hypothetical protein